MSIPEIVPGDRGGEATQDVAELLSAIALPTIEPFGTDSPLLAGLPNFIPAPVPSPEPLSQLGVARSVYDSTVAALEALRRHEDAISACKAALVDRLMGASSAEAHAMNLDPWQAGICESSTHSELALALRIPERSAATLAHRSTELVTNHRLVFLGLQAGKFSTRHAWVIVDEVATLLGTPGITTEHAAAFEQRLLRLAPGSTASSFAPKARRAREATHPETISTRTRAAHADRAMTLDAGKDGMSWLTLHLPSLAAEGIWVNCTRTARAIKSQHRAGGNGGAAAEQAENRTLTQLRVDVAAALLLGQQPLPGFTAGDDAGAGSSRTADGPGASYAQPTPAAPPAGGSGYSQGLVDGIGENFAQEYLDQVEALRSNKLVAGSPLPEATILVTVPFLGALGITQDPAELVGSTSCSGPVPLDIARRLMLKTGSFLRVLTDPVTGEPLGLAPERYRLREPDKAVLRALTGGCYFPGCTNPVMDTETDHLKAYEYGGRTTLENLRPSCRRHHALRHFKDDKDRHGNYRSIQDPDRHSLRLRGWTPSMDSAGNLSWSSPSGREHRSPCKEPQPPSYPAWLQHQVDAATGMPPQEPDTSQQSGARPVTAGSSMSPFEQLLVSYVKKHGC